MPTPKLTPARIFTEMLAAVEARRESIRARSRASSRRYRESQDPEELKARQRKWELTYRKKLKSSDPEKYRGYCNGRV